VDLGQLVELMATNRGPVSWIAPVYEFRQADFADYLAILPHRILIEMNAKSGPEDLKELRAKYGLGETREGIRSVGKFLYCSLRDPEKLDAIRLREKLEEDPRVQSVELETVPMFVPTAFVPNDTLFPDQWNMERIRAGGGGQTGWNLERGEPGVIICVLDEGCDLAHPDLRFTPAPSGINLGTMAPDGSPTGDHGTACAGIAAAITNNGQGVAGVAGGCTVLPVAFDTWSDVEVAAGIEYAADNGARVLSMSFGWNAWSHAIIDPAIQYAFDANVVVCVATHNYNGPITYPATHPLVIACGASDQADNRKSPTSPDGEGWGSNFGPEIAVVAPGVLCPSTDRLAGAGYDAGDYVPDFNGTSAATPHVAGLAALLISADQTLTNVEVRAIIESTAAKAGVTPYAIDPGHANGTWNQEMGYGRIDVLAALQVVSKRCHFDLKRLLIEEKRFILDEFGKLRRFKEKERIDEVKSIVGYENPEIFDPGIYERLHLPRNPLGGTGQPFIRPSERPNVGQSIASKARSKRK
jgi:subtilisin family serine protease